MKRTMRCCSCGFEEEIELPDDTTLEQLLKIGNEWRLFKHQPNCNSDPIKDGTFPTTEISEKPIVVRTVAEAAGVECPKKTGTMSKDESCENCENWRVCYLVILAASQDKLDPSCTLVLPCYLCRAEILCNYKKSNWDPEDIDVTARLMSGTDSSRCLLHDKIVGVHDKACSDKSSPFRQDDVRVPVIWRILGLTEDVCGVCRSYEALRKCVESAVANGDLPAEAVSLEDGDQAQAQDQERLKKELMLKRFYEAKTEEMGDKDFRRFINSLHEDLDLEDQDLERLSKHLNGIKKVDAATKFIEDQEEI